MNFRMISDKAQRRIQFFRVDQCHQRQDGRKSGCGKHEFHHAQIAMALEHAALKLACKAIKENFKLFISSFIENLNLPYGNILLDSTNY